MSSQSKKGGGQKFVAAGTNDNNAQITTLQSPGRRASLDAKDGPFLTFMRGAAESRSQPIADTMSGLFEISR